MSSDARERASSLFGGFREPRTPVGARRDEASALDQATGGLPVRVFRRRRVGDSIGEAPAPEPTRGRSRQQRNSTWRQAVRQRLPPIRRPLWTFRPKALAALALLLVAAGLLAVYHFWSGRPRAVQVPASHARVEAGRTPGASPGSGETGSADGVSRGGETRPGGDGTERPRSGMSAADDSVVVDVTGEVRRPGVIRLPKGARVTDALKAAGGVRSGTDTSALNQARLVADGEQIVVGAQSAPAAGGGSEAGKAGAGVGAAQDGAAGTGARVSLNAATADQLETLPGVGPVLAQRILDYRTEHGGFRAVEELRDVGGIGQRRFADLRPLVQP